MDRLIFAIGLYLIVLAVLYGILFFIRKKNKQHEALVDCVIQNLNNIKLKDDGPDIDEVVGYLIANDIKCDVHIYD